MADSALTEEVDRLVARLARLAAATGRSIGVAESLTGGQLAAALSAAEGAGDWFRGGIVAYHPEVKYELLGAPRGPVVTPETASAMARSARGLLGADCTAALTGVGGPGPDEGKPAGTVYLATAGAGSTAAGSTAANSTGADGTGTDGVGDTGVVTEVEGLHFDGDPIEVIAKSIEAALTALIRRLESDH